MDSRMGGGMGWNARRSWDWNGGRYQAGMQGGIGDGRGVVQRGKWKWGIESGALANVAPSNPMSVLLGPLLRPPAHVPDSPSYVHTPGSPSASMHLPRRSPGRDTLSGAQLLRPHQPPQPPCRVMQPKRWLHQWMSRSLLAR